MGVRSYYIYNVGSVGHGVGGGVVCGMCAQTEILCMCVCECVCVLVEWSPPPERDTPHLLIPVHTQERATYSR
jgi:hypothetical protein